MVDPFDIDRLFKEIEKYIEDATNRYGAYKYKSSYPTSYDDFFTEDKDHIYMTVELGIEPKKLHAHIEKEDELVIEIDTGIDRITLPTKVKKVESVTCVNGILDIIIAKDHGKEGERERKEERRD